jgi:hypothetical protein
METTWAFMDSPNHSIDLQAAAHAALSIVHSQVKQTTIVASSHVCSLSSPQ